MSNRRKRLRSLFTFALCSVLMWTSVVPARADVARVMDEAAIRTQYPNAKIIQVEAADYPQLAESLRRQGYLTQAEVQASGQWIGSVRQPSPEIPPPYQPASSSDDCNDRQTPSAGEESVRVMVNFSNDMMKSGGNNRDSAAVVFVIIGTVLIVVWALYIFKYIYDVTTGFTPCGKWSELALTSSSISGTANQHARFYGLRYMTGYRDGATEFGISAELGQSDILLADLNLPEMKGTYWFIGPVLRWRLSRSNNPSYFQMNFMAGSTEFDAMGTIAQANLGLQFGIGNAMRLGLSWGAMNINLNNDQGIISDREQYYYLYGVSMGYQF